MMSGNYHDSTFLTLGSLPSDIIRIILREREYPKDTLRLVSNCVMEIRHQDSREPTVKFQISPAWNALIVDHLSHRQNHLPLKRVCFKAVKGNILTDDKIKMIVASESFSQNDVSRRVFDGWTLPNPDERVSTFPFLLLILPDGQM